jgi:hypothetical protein
MCIIHEVYKLIFKGPKPLGEKLEVWARSYNVNFHYDFLKPFLEVRNVLALWGYIIFFTRFKKKQLCCLQPISSRLASYKYTKKLPNLFYFILSCGLDP